MKLEEGRLQQVVGYRVGNETGGLDLMLQRKEENLHVARLLVPRDRVKNLFLIDIKITNFT